MSDLSWLLLLSIPSGLIAYYYWNEIDNDDSISPMDFIKDKSRRKAFKKEIETSRKLHKELKKIKNKDSLEYKEKAKEISKAYELLCTKFPELKEWEQAKEKKQN